MLIQTLLGSGDIKSKLMFIGFYLVAILVSLSFHEFAHAFTAHLMGDDTAKNLGRMTVNPFAHIDPFGFLLLLIAGFGWAKPVPVNTRNFRKFKLGEFIVSSAGIFTNLVLAFFACIGFVAFGYLGLAGKMDVTVSESITLFFYIFGIINCALAIFNLIPLYPLDGYRLFELFFGRLLGSRVISWLHNYGHFILYGLLILSTVIARSTGFSPISVAANWLFDRFTDAAAGIVGLFV